MLFKADINEEALKSEDKLCEQLYVFLKEFVPKRLRYESSSEHEDCIQETILYLIKRYRQISPETAKKLNMERFFYNRANSFVSGYLTKLKIERTAFKKYMMFVESEKKKPEKEETVNYKVLTEIIKKYNLSSGMEKVLMWLSEIRLFELGYDIIPQEATENLEESVLNALYKLSYPVIDEYIVKIWE